MIQDAQISILTPSRDRRNLSIKNGDVCFDLFQGEEFSGDLFYSVIKEARATLAKMRESRSPNKTQVDILKTWIKLAEKCLRVNPSKEEVEQTLSSLEEQIPPSEEEPQGE